jgi:hypothetical protein
MVPGMTERDRLAVDASRLAWLADATLGPTHIGIPAQGPTQASTARPTLPIGIWHRALSSARILGQRIRLLKPVTDGAPDGRATSPVR